MIIIKQNLLKNNQEISCAYGQILLQAWKGIDFDEPSMVPLKLHRQNMEEIIQVCFN